MTKYRWMFYMHEIKHIALVHSSNMDPSTWIYSESMLNKVMNYTHNREADRQVLKVSICY